MKKNEARDTIYDDDDFRAYVQEANKPIPRIKTISGRTIALKNLRPGDWLLHEMGVKFMVDSNWPSLKKFEASFVFDYDAIDKAAWVYLGRGRKRKWLKHLPAFLRDIFSPYSKP